MGFKKARDFRLMDQKQWDEWREVFTEDVTAVYQGAPRRGSDDMTELRYDQKGFFLNLAGYY